MYFICIQLKWRRSLASCCLACMVPTLSFSFVPCSDCSETWRPDRCHVDLIATATSKEHRPQLLRGWNQGLVSLFFYLFFFPFDFLFHILNPICPHLKRDTSLCGKHDIVWQLIICYFLATLSALGALVNILKSNDLIRRLICLKLIFRTAWSD